MSFGLERPRQECTRDQWAEITDMIRKEVEYAANRNVLMFAAASNCGINAPRAFPANIKHHIIGVHASDGNGNDGKINADALPREYNFTTLGIALKAPNLHGGDWVYKSGTSFATAVAAGMAAVMWDMGDRPELMAKKTRTRLRTHKGMELMFHLMSKRDRTRGAYDHVAPWLLWKRDSQLDEKGWRRARRKIEDAFVEAIERGDFLK
jgi:hypothetical protein